MPTHPDIAKWLRGLESRPGLAPGFAIAEHQAVVKKERALASTVFDLREELEDLCETCDAIGLEELSQKLGAYQRESRKLYEQRKRLRSIRSEILQHVASKVRDLDSEQEAG